MFRFVTQAPITFCSLVLLATVFAGTHGVAGDSAAELSRLQRRWGVAQPLHWVETEGPRAFVRHPELRGPFDLWNGQWWRVPVSTLHHGGLAHLLLNSLAVALLGRMLERAWGSPRYLLFLVGAALASAWPEYLLEQYAVGYSGVVCAIFGALIVVRHAHPDIAEQVTDGYIITCLAMLVGMWVLTEVAAVPIANYAHFAGLAYGWCVAQAARRPLPARLAMVAAHVWLLIPYWGITHPVWNGRYHWYLAGFTPTGQLAARENPDRLRLAVARDPSLAAVWLLLAQDAQRSGDPLEAWRLALQGLRAEPTNPPLWAFTRQQWRRLVIGPQRQPAIAAIQEIFGDQSSGILAEVRKLKPPPVLIAPGRPIGPPPVVAEIEHPAWQPASDEVRRAFAPRRDQPLTIDPADPRSAVEGELL
jgi:rhomboid protease GluP